MKNCLLLLSALLLTACGVMGGGSSYRVEVVDPSGRVFRATADTVQAAESVDLQFQGNPLTGEITGLTFSKTGAQTGGWNNAVLEKALDRIPAR